MQKKKGRQLKISACIHVSITECEVGGGPLRACTACGELEV